MSYGIILPDTKRWLTEINDISADQLETGNHRIDIIFNGALDEAWNVDEEISFDVFRLVNEMMEIWYPYGDWELSLYNDVTEPPERLSSTNNQEKAR